MIPDSQRCARLLPHFISLALVGCATAPVTRTSSGTLILDETTQTTRVTGTAAAAVPMPRTLQPRRTVELARGHNLVDVRTFIPGISVDLRYATAENVTHRPLYDPRMPCLLRIETAEKLKAAQAILRAQGYGIRVWDAYRTPEVQEALHQAGASTHMFLSPESAGWSRHCGGVSVDVTLVDASNRELQLPTGFDAGLKNASAAYRGGNAVVAKNLQILQDAMRQAGFNQVTAEWWHFDDRDFAQNPQPIVYGRQLAIPPL